MNPILKNLRRAVKAGGVGRRQFTLWVSFWAAVTVTAISIVGYLIHLNLSAIGSIYLMMVVLVSLRWGFAQATVTSVMAIFAMNYFFIPPIFEFQVADAENWISLATFETAALVVSGLSSKVLEHAAQADLERERTAKLYDLSRLILLIDGTSSTSEQLGALIREVVNVESVDFWVPSEGGPTPEPSHSMQPSNRAYATFKSLVDSDDPIHRTTGRILRLGTTPIGALVLRGWEHDALLADAVSSLAAVAIERMRALHKENRAEAERNTEQLRTAVLDGLAHGFKTPLTAIQTASSGLLAIAQMTPTQTELVSIIDEQATMLGQMTTRLLQTAALESRDVRLHRSRTSMLVLVERLVSAQESEIRARLMVRAIGELESIDVDAHMIELALLQLIDNAAKYSLGDRRIEISVEQNDCETTIVVANSGSQIQPDETTRIFERFYRGINSSHSASGTGLGLSIVRKTAEAHGGRVWVESDKSTTRFFFNVENYRGVSNV